jgi:Amidases related to nicotinamidase
MVDQEDNKALLIVDMLKDFIDKGAPLEVPAGRWVVENIAGEIRYHREKKRPIIYICDRHEPNDPEFEYWPPHAIKGTPGADVIEALSPKPTDYIIEKTSYSAFFRTNLEQLLKELDIDEVLVCGVLTNICVLYTAVDALMRGIRVIVPETCVAALNETDHKWALRQINEVLKPVSR